MFLKWVAISKNLTGENAELKECKEQTTGQFLGKQRPVILYDLPPNPSWQIAFSTSNGLAHFAM
ncbi:MAG: hypothetical protein KC449_12135 [Anaerolineales bacterium]|nr:hypothetical protein [Anaerolineales bacterium]